MIAMREGDYEDAPVTKVHHFSPANYPIVNIVLSDDRKLMMVANSGCSDCEMAKQTNNQFKFIIMAN